MSDNTNAVAILQDLSSYWRERAKDYIENYMEEDDSDDIEDPIYAKLRFCDIIDDYVKTIGPELPVEDILHQLYLLIPEKEQTDFVVDYFVGYAIELGTADYDVNNDKKSTIDEKIKATVKYSLIKEMVAFLDDEFGECGMEILLDEVPTGEYFEEGESYTYDYFDRQYDKLGENLNNQSDTFKCYELICHLKAVVASFSEEDKKNAGKERNLKFEKIEKTWTAMGKVMAELNADVIPDISESFVVEKKE